MFQWFSDASGEIHYSCESINSKIPKNESESNMKVCPIGWDFSNNSYTTPDVGKPYERQGPDLFVQNGIPTCIMSPEPIYAEIKKKPTSIFQVCRNNVHKMSIKIELLSRIEVVEGSLLITSLKYHTVSFVCKFDELLLLQLF